VACFLAAVGIAYTKWENKKRDRGERDNRIVGLSETEINSLGYRSPEFRYTS